MADEDWFSANAPPKQPEQDWFAQNAPQVAQPEKPSIPALAGRTAWDVIKQVTGLHQPTSLSEVAQEIFPTHFENTLVGGMLGGAKRTFEQGIEAAKTPDFSPEKFAFAGNVVGQAGGQLLGLLGLKAEPAIAKTAPTLAETAGIAKPEVTQPVEPVATDVVKTEPIAPAEPDLTAVNRELAPTTEPPSAISEPFPSISRSSEDARRVEQQQAPPAVREAISLDEIRLMRERDELNAQNDIAKAATGGTHPAVDERLGQIDEQLTNIANKELQPVGTEPAPIQKQGGIDAVQEQSPSSILQHPQESVGTSGGERVGVEPSVQGETPTGTRSEGVAGTAQEEVAHPLQGNVYYRGSHPLQKGGDTFYSADRSTAEEYSAHGAMPEGGKVEEVKGESLPSKLYDTTSKEQLAEDLGIKGDTRGLDFDNKVKAKLQSQGYEGVRYSEGTSLGDEIQTPQEELHVFSEAKPAPVSQPTETPTAPPTEPPTTTETVPVSDQPHVSTIANRFTQERTASGELGEIAPGQGYSAKEMAAQGLKMQPEEINQHVSDLMNGTGDPVKQGMAVRAEEARLSQHSNELSRAAAEDPSNIEKRTEADNAFKDVTDFHNGPVARLKTVFHATGVGLQGELPVDLSTFNGLREKFLRDTGKPPTPEQEPQLEQMAEKVRNSVKEDNGAKQSLGKAIDKATARQKLPTYDEVRQNISDRMKLEPCRV